MSGLAGATTGSPRYLRVGIEHYDLVPFVQSIDELQHTENIAQGVLEGNDKDRSGPIAIPGIQLSAEGIGPIRRNLVNIGNVDNLPRQRHMAGEARLAEGERLGLQAAFHLPLSDPADQGVILDDGESELISLAKEQGARVGARKAPGLQEDSLEEDREVSLTCESNPDLNQLFQGRVRSIDGAIHAPPDTDAGTRPLCHGPGDVKTTRGALRP